MHLELFAIFSLLTKKVSRVYLLTARRKKSVTALVQCSSFRKLSTTAESCEFWRAQWFHNSKITLDSSSLPQTPCLSSLSFTVYDPVMVRSFPRATTMDIARNLPTKTLPFIDAWRLQQCNTLSYSLLLGGGCQYPIIVTIPPKPTTFKMAKVAPLRKHRWKSIGKGGILFRLGWE